MKGYNQVKEQNLFKKLIYKEPISASSIFMKSSQNDRSSSKQKHKSPSPSNSQSMKDINNLKLNKLGKCFHIVDSPEIVFDLCDKAYTKSRQTHQFTLLSKDKVELAKPLLQDKRKVLQRKGCVMNRTANETSDSNFSQVKNRHNLLASISATDKITFFDDRKFYQTIRDRLKQLVEKVQKQTQIMISEVMILKQDILSSFFSEIIEKSKRQCKEKGQLIHYIWNSMFSILELALQQITKQKNHHQKLYLTENINNHHKYQDMLDFDKQKIISLKQEIHKGQVFNNTLVFNLRCKRRQLRKSYIKLKICTNKLNEYKSNFLDLQRQHIDLIMETRDISKDMAQFLFKRRQQILQEKKKNFRLKFSKKSNFVNTKRQIEKQPSKDLQLINDQLKAAFNKQYEKQMALGDDKKLKKLTNFLFQDATDEFAFYENTDNIDEDLMAAKMQTTFVDAETDMIGFQIQAKNQDCQVEYIEKIVHGLVKNITTQTTMVQEKPKKVFFQTATQINNVSLDQLNYQIQNKVYDMSFLFEGKKNNTKKITINKQVQKKPRSRQVNKQTINQDESSLESIKFQSKNLLNSHKKISRKISQISQALKYRDDQVHESQEENSQSKNKFDTQNNGQNNVQIDDQQKLNVLDFVSRFALKKGLGKKKKTGVPLCFQKQERYSSVDKTEEEVPASGFAKTQKNSLFSRQTQRIQKNSASSLQTSPKKSILKSNLVRSAKKLVKQQKKQLKREPISRRQNDYQIQSRVETNLKNLPLNSNVIKLLNKTIKEHVDSMNSNDLLLKLKGNNNLNFIIDEEMQDFIKQKDDEEKQRFFKNFSQSISSLIMDLDKSIESTKKHHRTLLPSRHKTLCKIISNVYMQAYQLLEKKQKLYSLINPLFKYFEMGYGMLKKYDLYSRMISFLSHACIHKEESQILYSFYFFTGLDKENPLSVRITSNDFELYLKMLRSLSLNFNVNGLNVQNLYTSNFALEKSIKEVLVEEKISDMIIEKVLSKVQQKLQKMTGVDIRSTFVPNDIPNKFSGTNSDFSRTLPQTRSQSGWSTQRKSPPKAEEEQIKLDVFKCCQLIMQEIITIRKVMEQSYLPLIAYTYEEEENMKNIRIDEELLQFIIRCQFKQKISEIKSYRLLNKIFKINSLYNQQKLKLNSGRSIFKSEASIKTKQTIRTLKSIKIIQIDDQKDEIQQKDTLSINQMCTFFIKANIFDFNKTYYNALNIFKLREEAALSMCIKRLPEIRKFFEKQNLKIESILLQEITEDGKIDQLMSPHNFISYEPINTNVTRNFNHHNPNEPSLCNQKQTTNGPTLKHIHKKKILILCFLRFLQSQANTTIENMLGQELKLIHTLIPMSKIKV